MANSNNKPKGKKPIKFVVRRSKGGRKFGGPSRGPVGQGATVLLTFLILITIYSLVSGANQKKEEVTLSQLAQDINTEQVEKIGIRGDGLNITYVDGVEKVSKKEEGTALTTTLKNYNITPADLEKVDITVENNQGFFYWLAVLAPILIPIIFILFFLWFISRQVKGAGMQAFTFGQSKARLSTPGDKSQKVTFKDVAGAKEAKEELREIVDFLKNPKKFLEIGARIPKGVLLMGAPGTGKTLLARAVAGEAGVSFFSISGSEFVEMFVGVGASRVRDLFDVAKKAAPAIIFVDEIDAVGRVRGTGVGGGNDEREQTLNQILVELDGFEPNEKVIVMAATNRPDVLDPALLRPGRFDRRVTLDLPDRKDREEILQIHARKKPFAEDVKLGLIAERTPGFSGADLYSLMNEGAILAAREDRTKISQYDLIRSIEKVMLGPERRSHILSKKEKELAAYHEAGHALIASILPYADPVHKISIISRGSAAGYVLKIPLEDRRLQSKKEFLDDIAVGLGGYVVEKMLYDDLTTGPSSDLQVVTAIARSMITKYGMSDKLGPVALEGIGGKQFGPGVDGNGYSEDISAKIDAEVNAILSESTERVEKLVKENRKVLNAIAERLIEVETIEQKEFQDLLIANGITPKKKEDIEHQA